MPIVPSLRSHLLAALAVAVVAACDATANVAAPTGPVITVLPTNPVLRVGDVQTFTARVTGTSTSAVSWSVEEATGGNIDQDGRYTAPGGTGLFHVVATLQADTGIKGRANVTVNAAGAPIAPAAPMPLISRSVPATASAGTASWGQDASYGGILWGFHMAAIGATGWLTYDLSGVPAAQRGQIVVALYMGKGDQYKQLDFRAANPSYTYDQTAAYVPFAYVLEGATSASGPWTTLVDVPTNCNPFKSHAIDFTGYTFLRFRSTSGPYGGQVKMDVYDASRGISDGIVFYGDSITTNIFSSHGNGYGPEWLSKRVQAATPAFFPYVIGGGIPFMTAADARDVIVLGTGGFATGLPSPAGTIFRDAKYAALVYGANDAAAQSLVDGFRAAYHQIIDALRANGQTVIVAVPTWATDTGRQAGLVQLRGQIGYTLPAWAAGSFSSGDYVWSGTRVYRCTTAGTSVSGPTGTGTGIADGGTARWSYVPSLREDYAADPNVVGGPDLYMAFLNHPEWFGDGLHPNAAGEVVWRDTWVNWFNSAVY